MKLNCKPLVVVLAASALAAALCACAPLLIGGAAVGAMMTYDRRTSGAQVEDETIELRGASRLRETLGDRAHVNINSYNRQVLLTGEVPNEQAKQTAEQAVNQVDNVKAIVNDLTVMPNTTMTQRSSDTLITGKVKASLVDEKSLSVTAFDVVTERSVVYLMGRVTQREADLATQIARTVSGVQRVVRIFEVITEEEARRLTPQFGSSTPAPAAAKPAAAPAATPTAATQPEPSSSPTSSPTTASSVSPTALPPLAPASAKR